MECETEKQQEVLEGRNPSYEMLPPRFKERGIKGVTFSA